MIKTVLVDDLNGSTDKVETVKFSLDGSHYEIDLDRGNAKELRTALAAYKAVARPSRPYTAKPKDKTPASSARKAKRKSARSGPTASEVRAWAREQGIDVTPTGRVPKTLMDQFEAATRKIA